MAHHLSRLESNMVNSIERDFDMSFTDECVMDISNDVAPRYVDFANYIMCGILSEGLYLYQRKMFLFDDKIYYWDEPCLFRECVDHDI